ncbi:MAG: peptidoglycan DD-metalloendopeptidase family protein [Desulfamplus sp.]|nr:peptidoglycan DD-metalloendopeptidase family protein [Desulfamplus sp.]
MNPFVFFKHKTVYIFSISILISLFALSIPDISLSKPFVQKAPTTSPPYLDDKDSPSRTFKYFAKTQNLSMENFSEIRGRVRQGDTLAKILNPHGLTNALIFKSAKASKQIFDVKKIRSGKWYSIILDRRQQNSVRYFIYEKDIETYVVFNFGDEVKVNIANKKVEMRTRHIHLAIEGCLDKTLVRHGLPRELTAALKGIFDQSPNLDDLRAGDRVQLAFEEKYIMDRSSGFAHVKAAVITTSKGRYQAYRFTHNGRTGYYDEKGKCLGKAFLKYPLEYRAITSGFTTKRLHPVTKKYRSHPGIDFAASMGTPVKSVGDGIVIFKGYCKSAGNYIKIDHPGVGISEYLHFSKFHPSIKRGVAVSKGDIIGYVGKTGYATGPHLDLRFMINGRYVDYTTLELPDGSPVPEEEMPRYMNDVAMTASLWKQGSTKVTMNLLDRFLQPYRGEFRKNNSPQLPFPSIKSVPNTAMPSPAVPTTPKLNPSDRSFTGGIL